jgi:hypothetical protein
MSDKIKIQHYVPKFYLRNFSVKGKRPKLYCLDKTKLTESLTNITNVACEGYFYDGIGDVGQVNEKALSQLETKFRTPYRKVVEQQDFACLDAHEKWLLAAFIVTQELRTKEHREELRDMIKQTILRIKEKFNTDRLPREFEQAQDDEYVKALHLSTLSDVPEYVAIVTRGMKWLLLLNETDTPYWTSDHPVNRYNDINTGLGTLGLLSRGVEIHFPLSPRLSICFCDPEASRGFPDKYSADARIVEFLNHLQVKGSTRWVFSNRSGFSLAHTMLAENPLLADVHRKRCVVH